MPSPTGLARLIACVVVALALAACGVVPNPLATPVPPDALHPIQPVPVGETPAPDPEKLSELDVQRAIWDRAGLANYRIRLVYGCDCALAGKTVDVTVRDGAIAEASIDGNPFDRKGLIGFPATVDQLFDYAERNAGAGKVELAYDDALGYPTALGVDPDLQDLDDSIRIAVLELAAGR